LTLKCVEVAHQPSLKTSPLGSTTAARVSSPVMGFLIGSIDE
jgi:hypothetical protein